MKAVIIAAGEGSRLREQGESAPKPLARLGGLPLLERTIRNGAVAGASEFVVVVGHRANEVTAALQSKLRDFAVGWVVNDDWPLGSGTSVLAARPHVGDEPFLILMSDHLILPATLRALIRNTSQAPQCRMAVDRKWHLLADLDDAMKVRLENGRVTKIGKALEDWDAVDIGATVCWPVVFDELERARAPDGGVSHSAGMRGLAERGWLLAHDIGDDRWEDVDTEPARRAAERILFDWSRAR